MPLRSELILVCTNGCLY